MSAEESAEAAIERAGQREQELQGLSANAWKRLILHMGGSFLVAFPILFLVMRPGFSSEVERWGTGYVVMLFAVTFAFMGVVGVATVIVLRRRAPAWMQPAPIIGVDRPRWRQARRAIFRGEAVSDPTLVPLLEDYVDRMHRGRWVAGASMLFILLMGLPAAIDDRWGPAGRWFWLVMWVTYPFLWLRLQLRTRRARHAVALSRQAPQGAEAGC